jgi:hypothetical protein
VPVPVLVEPSGQRRRCRPPLVLTESIVRTSASRRPPTRELAYHINLAIDCLNLASAASFGRNEGLKLHQSNLHA